MCLHIAAANGHADIVQLLIRLGADLKAREGLQGYTALHIAVKGQCRALFDVLLLECQRASCLDVRTYYGRTTYQLAQEYNGKFFEEACKKLVQYGAMPEPLPESDSDSSDSEDEETSSTGDYLPASEICETQLE
jgi:ankyrin repeat protein